MERPLKLYLQELECHFTWNIRSLVGKKDLEHKLAEKSEEIDGKPLITLVINLTLAYELFLKNDPGANEKLKMCILMWANTVDPFVLQYKDAFRHIIYSLKLFFIKDTSSKNIIKEVSDLIPSISALAEEQRNAITFIKAHVFSEYGPEGTKYALTLIREIIKTNPEEGEYHLFLGKMLSRIRHFYMDRCVTEEELQSFRTAHAKCKSAATSVFLAQTTCELTRYLFLKAGRVCNGNDGRIIRTYNEQAHKLFKQALTINENKCTHINFRCANGLRLLPNEFRDLELALKLIESTLQRAPTNVYGNSVACAIYQTLKQYEKAIKHAKIAVEGGSFGCAFKLLNMFVELKPDFDVETELQNLIEKFPEEMYVIQTYLGGIAYFIFKKYNIYIALKYFFKLADLNVDLERFNYYVYWAKDSVDLCFVIYNEVKCAIEKKMAKSAKEQAMLRNAITCINSHYPVVTERKVKSDLVKQILGRYVFKNRSRKPLQARNYKNNYTAGNFNRNKNNNNSKINNSFIEKSGEKSEKHQKKRNSQKNVKSRSNSVCSVKSDSSVSSLTTTNIYKRTRRNSKEALVLGIVKKDMELENRLESITKGQQTPLTSLRPETNKVLTSNDPENKMVLGKPSFSLGCKGWGGSGSNMGTGANMKEDKMLLLTKMFSDTKINDSKRIKSPQENIRKPYNIRSNNESLDSDTTRCRTPSNYGTAKYQSKDKNPKFLGDKEREFCPPTTYYQSKDRNPKFLGDKEREFCPPTTYTRSNYNRYNSFDKREGQKPVYDGKSDNNSGNRNKNRYNFNDNSKYSRNSPHTNSPQKIIRKPFNLRSSRESLDSDDSELCSLSQNFDRLSTSSVDSDYVRGTRKSCFSWNQ